MEVISSKRNSDSWSDNLKSKIQKRPRGRKWVVGFLALVIAFVGVAGGVEAQQPKKVPRIGYLSVDDASS